MRYLQFILLWWSALSCLAQNKGYHSYQLHHFNVNDGLPSSEVYYALQDSKGYLWVATDAGVVRYKGDRFQIFDQSNGMTDNTVFQMYEDIQGRIWFGTFNLKLCYFWKDSIYPYQFNENIEKQTQITRGVNNLYVDASESVFLGFDGSGIIEIDSLGVIKAHTPAADSTCSYVSWRQCAAGCIYGNSFVYTNDFQIQFDIQLATDTILLRHRFADKLPTSRIVLVPVDNNQFLLFGFKNVKLITANNKGDYDIKDIKSNFRKPFVYSYLYVEPYHWLSVQDYGVCKTIFRNDSLLILHQILKEDRIATIFKDKGNGFWFQSLNDGIYYLPDENIEQIDIGSQVVDLAIDTVKQHLYVSTIDRDVFQIDLKLPKDTLRKLNSQPFIYKSFLHYNYHVESLIIHAHQKMKSYQFNNDSLSLFKTSQERFYRQIQIFGDTLIGVCSKGLAVEVKDQLVVDPDTCGFWGKCLLKLSDGSILIGTNDGLKKYQNNLIQEFVTDSLLQTSVTSMVQYGDYILVGTKENGILVVSDTSVYDQINREMGLQSDLIRVLHLDNRGVLWAGTNMGLHRIDYSPADKSSKISLISTNLGLPSNEITAIQNDHSFLYVGTKKGLCRINTNQLHAFRLAPEVAFQELRINHQPYKITDDIALQYYQNSIFLKFLALNYRSLGKVEFQYRLLGIDSNWISTSKNELFFSGLPYGTFQLQLKALNEEGLLSKALSISFFIAKPLWLRWWFVASCIGLLGLLFFVALKNRERKIVEQAYLETKLVDLELKGLRSQMNPYFIFNTLNSIQHAINTKEKQFASDFIAQFGRLIRLVLESSKKSTILLTQEIEILHLYVELESFTFADKLLFNIKLEDGLEDDFIAIPSMVIQPFVEHAIVCSLKPSDRDDLKLEVVFSMLDETMLKCTIEYNGLSRLASNFVNEASVLETTKNRLEHFSRETNNKFSIEFYDLTDAAGLHLGTKIEIVFVL